MRRSEQPIMGQDCSLFLRPRPPEEPKQNAVLPVMCTTKVLPIQRLAREWHMHMEGHNMFETHRVEIEWAGRPLILETGKIARQADGAVLATYGETVVLATVV